MGESEAREEKGVGPLRQVRTNHSYEIGDGEENREDHQPDFKCCAVNYTESQPPEENKTTHSCNAVPECPLEYRRGSAIAKRHQPPEPVKQQNRKIGDEEILMA